MLRSFSENPVAVQSLGFVFLLGVCTGVSITENRLKVISSSSPSLSLNALNRLPLRGERSYVNSAPQVSVWLSRNTRHSAACSWAEGFGLGNLCAALGVAALPVKAQAAMSVMRKKRAGDIREARVVCCVGCGGGFRKRWMYFCNREGAKLRNGVCGFRV